jgi:DNA-binding CsgD family transcriptional regulator
MDSISGERFTVLNSALQMLYAPCALDDLPQRLLAVARCVLPSDGNAYNEVNPKLARAIGVMDNPDWKMENLVEPLEAHMHEHPIINYCQQTRDGSARKISDFLSQTEFHRTGLFNELYRPLGIGYQMAISLPTPGDEIIAVVVNRCGKDFSEEDRAVLNLLRPHMAQAYHNALAANKLVGEIARLNGAMSELQQSIIVVDPKLRIGFASPRSLRVLRQFFGPRVSAARLPVPLESWLLHHLGRNWRRGKIPPVREPLRVFANDRWLHVRWLANITGGELTLVLQEQASAGSAGEKLRPLGLTSREAEALYWVAQGKTNPEISIICGISARTVQKHLERIFKKLRVETRTAAALRASELL